MWAKFCGFLLKTMGWTSVGGPVPDKKAVILGVPHTSAWDFVVSYLFYAHFGKKAYVMIKKEFFWGPMGWILRKLGGIPVDRSNATNMLKSLITEMEKKDEFVIAIAPEGSRKPVKKWKTGYHLIAREVGCPVYLGYFDYKKKEISVGQRFDITENAREDTDKIQAIYEEMHLEGKHKEKFITH